jgi:hypothetical protein
MKITATKTIATGLFAAALAAALVSGVGVSPSLARGASIHDKPYPCAGGRIHTRRCKAYQDFERRRNAGQHRINMACGKQVRVHGSRCRRVLMGIRRQPNPYR